VALPATVTVTKLVSNLFALSSLHVVDAGIAVHCRAGSAGVTRLATFQDVARDDA
jgi:hypothetical protein